MGEGLRRATLAALATQRLKAGTDFVTGAEVVALYEAIRRDAPNPLAAIGLGRGAWTHGRARAATRALQKAGLLQYDRVGRRWEALLRSPATPRCPNGCPPRSTPVECGRACYPAERTARTPTCICPCHEGDVPDVADDDPSPELEPACVP